MILVKRMYFLWKGNICVCVCVNSRQYKFIKMQKYIHSSRSVNKKGWLKISLSLSLNVITFFINVVSYYLIFFGCVSFCDKGCHHKYYLRLYNNKFKATIITMSIIFVGFINNSHKRGCVTCDSFMEYTKKNDLKVYKEIILCHIFDLGLLDFQLEVFLCYYWNCCFDANIY